MDTWGDECVRVVRERGENELECVNDEIKMFHYSVCVDDTEKKKLLRSYALVVLKAPILLGRQFSILGALLTCLSSLLLEFNKGMTKRNGTCVSTPECVSVERKLSFLQVWNISCAHFLSSLETFLFLIPTAFF